MPGVRRRSTSIGGVQAAALLAAAVVTVVAVVPAGAGARPLPASPHPRHLLANGLLPAWRHVRDRLVLDKQAVAPGEPVHATLVVVNRGRRTINLSKGECRPHYAVALRSHTYAPKVAIPATCSTLPFLIRPGVTRLPLTIQTTYLSCSSSGGVASGPTVPPNCTHSGPPPLRPGRYTTVLEGSGLALPQPTPVAVTLRT